VKKGKNASVTTKKRKGIIGSLRKDWSLWLFVLPGVILTFIFSYVPMYGVQLAFKKYNPKLGIWGSGWVGLTHFTRFFNSPYFETVIKNTLIISAYSLLAGFPIAIILALMLNSFKHKKYRKIIQTVTYAPNFISTVVMCGMLILFLSPSSGAINKVIAYFGGTAINFMAEKSYWRHIYVWSGVWQTMGWNSIVYFAALAGVSPELHEAAICDGASKFQIVRYIDFPSILPTATILLILNCGSIMSVGFEKVFLLQNDLNKGVSEIISTYTYQVGLIDGNISYSTGIGLFNSAVNAVLLIVVNKISDKLSGTSLY